MSKELQLVRNVSTLMENRQRGKKIFIGIDPGSHGAIGIVCGKDSMSFNIPTYKVKKGKGYKTLFKHDDIIHLFQLLSRHKSRIVVMLETGQLLWNTAFASFAVGVGYGMWPLFLKAMGFTVVETLPQTWKKRMGLAGKAKATIKKERSRTKALKLFPNADLKLKKDHDRAEAILLAVYARRLEQGRWSD